MLLKNQNAFKFHAILSKYKEKNRKISISIIIYVDSGIGMLVSGIDQSSMWNASKCCIYYKKQTFI